MLSLTIWGIGLLLMALVVFRACHQEFLLKYPGFFLYLIFVLVKSSSLLFVYLARPSLYARAYWSWHAEFVSALLGCAVVWEVYRGVLGRFPGAARMARNALIAVFVFVLSKAIADGWNGSAWWSTGTVIELERNLRGVQAGALIGLIVVIVLYRIPMGRNLGGMMLGYGLMISSNVVTLTLRARFGDPFQNLWRYLQPISYLVALVIWCLALWSYKAPPVAQRDAKIEEDYQVLVDTTTNGLLKARSYVKRALRP
jgi:hypothetical protein